MYVFLHNARGEGVGVGGPPAQEAVSVLKFTHYMILRVYTVVVWGGLVEVLGWFGVFQWTTQRLC